MTTTQAVFCTTASRKNAENIVERLKDEGFSGGEISVLLPDQGETLGFAHEKHTKAPEGAVAGVGTGGAVGGALGWLVGIGTLAIPGAGPFIAAGPILAALSGAAIGGALGGITGALIGMGIPEVEAKRYEASVREGKVLISVHAEDPHQLQKAKEVFRENGAEDVSHSHETAATRS